MPGGALSAGTVSLGVKGDASGFGAKLAADIKGQGSVFGDLGKHLGGLITAGLGAAGIAVGVGEILKTGIEEYSAMDKVNAQFAAGIKSTGNAANLSVEGMDKLAESIAGYSGQSVASIASTEQVLQTFKDIKNVGPDKIFDQATTAAANMAAKLGGDASSNARVLGKALEDPTKGMAALRRVGVMFTADQTAQVKAMQASGDTMGAQKVILDQLNTSFGGAAQAAGNTLTGELNKSKVAFGLLSETVVKDVLPMVLPAIQWIADSLTKATPFVEEFAKSFSEKLKEGVKSAQPFLHDIGTGARDLGSWITNTAIPAIKNFGQGIQDTTQWMKDHKQLLIDVAGVIGVLLIPVFVDMGVKATISAAQTVAAWVASKVEAATSAAAEFAAHYTAVAGWIAHAAAATATGVTNGIIWAQLYTEAALGAAKNIASHVLVAVSGWGVQAAAAITAGITTAGVWAEQALQAGLGAAKAIGGLLVVAGGWIATAATAMASGVIMAAAWIVGLGPVGWIIGAIVAVGAAFVALYTKVGWFRDGVNAAWNGIKVAFGAVVDWLVTTWNNYVYGLTQIPPTIGKIFGSIGGFVKSGFDGVVNFVKGIFNQITGLVNGVIDGINGATSLAGAIGVHIGVIPHLPRLALGATVLPTPGGTVVRVAEAGKAESVVDTGKLNNLLDQALGTGPRSSPVDLSDKSIAAIVEGNVAASKNVALTTTSADKWGSSMGRTTRPRGW